MIPDWAMRLPLNLIYCKATDFKLDAMLVASIIWQESKGFIYAARFEPQYKYLHRVDHFAKFQRITAETEENFQKTSFGMLQLMGATARWIGYDGALPALYKPENNLYWGCKFLASLKERYGDGEPMVAAYNAGSPRKTPGGMWENQKYVDAVYQNYRELTKVV